MISSSLRTANAIALARRKLLSKPSVCNHEKTRLLREFWGGGLQFSTQVFTARGGPEFQFCHRAVTTRMMSTTSPLRARNSPKKIEKKKSLKDAPSTSNYDPSPHRDPLTRPRSSPQSNASAAPNSSPELNPSTASPKPNAPPNTSPPTPLKSHPKAVITFISLSSTFAFLMAIYLGILYASIKKDIARSESLSVEEDVSNRYDTIAKTFDSDIETHEKLLFISRMRKKLCGKAKGDVCEVSLGTGRNLEYYDWDFGEPQKKGSVGYSKFIKRGKVTSFTAVDKSQEMLEVAHDKFGELYPGVLGIRWTLQDASEPLPPPPASANELSGHKVGKKFDTIIQTFGLCSTPDPVKLLKNLGDSLEPDGRILLLEHGRGKYEWINKYLDGLAPAHADRYGCWWNKDIGKLIEESGLEVVEIRRKHLGTTWWAELKLKPGREVKKQEESKEPLEGKRANSWFSGWF